MMGTADCVRMVSHTLKPLAPGMLMSSTSRSGSSLANSASAAVPSTAFTARNPACDSVKAIRSNRSRSSSAIRTFISCVSALDGQCKAESGALLRRALNDDGAAVTLDHRLDDPQAQSQPTGFRFRIRAAAEALEDTAFIPFGDSRALILDPRDDVGGIGRRPDAQHRTVG